MIVLRYSSVIPALPIRLCPATSKPPMKIEGIGPSSLEYLMGYSGIEFCVLKIDEVAVSDFG